MKKLFAIILACGLAMALAAPSVFAADFPSEPINYIIPFSPGGQSDLEARRQQPLLEADLGQKVIIQYKPGGGGSVGWAELSRTKPDGYTVCGINLPHIILQPMARGNAGFELSDLETIALFQATPIGLAVLKDSQFKTLDDLIEYAKKTPGGVTVGGSGTWSGHDLANKMLENAAGITMTYVPFKGAAPSIAGFLGGHVMALWGNSNDLYQHRDKLRVLAFGTKKPFEAMPEAPTFESLGYKVYASIDRGVAAPKGTPAERIKVLQDAFLKIANDPKIQEQMKSEGFVPLNMGTEEAKAYIAEQAVELKPVVEELLAAGHK